ncbi:MAG: DNA cytosine methyltransferase [Ginsengibacter sp.]
MIGRKVNIKAYQAKGAIRKKNSDFSIEETVLTHFDSVPSKSKKIAKEFFKNNIYQHNGYKNFSVEEAIQEYLFEVRAKVPFPGPGWGEEEFTFIDLFAGIGGFRLAMQEFGGKCVFSSEWDNSARQTYRSNFGDIPYGDITQAITKSFIPKNFDVLCAGFPCQPFSRAGVSARNFLGLEHGFNHPTQGNLFFEIIEIAFKHKPKVLFLENVKNLRSHDGGNTFRTIERMIRETGYSFFSAVINAETEVPQRRERTYMVCFRDDKIKFNFPEFKGVPKKLKSILEMEVPEEYTISNKLWEGHKRRTKNNIERGVGFTAFLANLEKPSNTIVARYGKDGKECLVPQEGKNPRKLTPRECARLQGFPKEFVLPSSNAAAYKQFGNSVAVPVIKKIGKEIIRHLLMK